MALPMVKTPYYTTKIPSTNQEIKFRPFLVKEEKSLLLAQQSENKTVMVDTLKQIIKSCVEGNINVDTLAMFDFEYLFTQIRCKSVGEFATLVGKCDTCIDDDKAKVQIQVDLTKCDVIIPDNHTKDIKLFDDVGVQMKYPNLATAEKIEEMNKGNIEMIFEVIADCIDTIYDSSTVYHAKEQTYEELLQFVENLTQADFKKLEEFFNTMPVLSQTVDYTCPVCSKEHKRTLKGIESFF